MFRVGELLIESEIGVRDARKNFADLLDSVGSGNRVIHISRRGKRISAIVSPDVAESVAAIRGPEGPAIPGDMVAAIEMIEGLLADDEDGVLDLMRVRPKPHGLVGACITLIDVLLSGPELQDGELRCKLEDGSFETKLVADLLVRKLYNRPEIRAAARDKLPLIAGSLWAAQVDGSAAEHRLRIPMEISATEGLVWVMAIWELCQLINVIHGDGTAEALMYETEETIRDAFGGTEFEVD